MKAFSPTNFSAPQERHACGPPRPEAPGLALLKGPSSLAQPLLSAAIANTVLSFVRLWF
jgi:hypothetical protein